MKRFFILLFVSILGISNCVFAANRVVMEKSYVEFKNIEPQVINGVLYLPVRDMAKNAGYNLLWNSDTKNIFITGENKRVVINIKDNTYTVNNRQYSTEVAILNGYSLIPMDVWATVFDKYAYWDSNEGIGAVVTPCDISMEDYLKTVEYCGRLMVFNSAYVQVKTETTAMVDSYTKAKDEQLLQQIREYITNDLASTLEELKAIEVPDFAVEYKNETLKLCQIKYDYINYYFDNVENSREYNEPVADLREAVVKQNVKVSAQLKGFFYTTADIDGIDDSHLQQAQEFSETVSKVNEEMSGYLYHIDNKEDINEELIKYGEALNTYSKEYKIKLKYTAETIFEDDVFSDNVKAIDFILNEIGSVGQAFIKAGNGEYSLNRAVLEENYIDFIWENISMFVIAEHFGFSFDYIYTPDLYGTMA